MSWLPDWSAPYIAAAAFAGGMAVAGPGAWYLGRLPLQAELATERAAEAQQKFRVAERAAQVLQAASDRGDALSAKLAQSQTQIDQLTRSRRNEIAKVTTGRACLDGPALRLLDGAPGLRVGGLAKTASGTAAADGAAASDTDITGWALDAGAQYETCRNRLDALIDWAEK